MPRKPNDKPIAVLLFFALLFGMLSLCITAEKKDDVPAVNARSASLYLPQTNTFLYRENAAARLPMASTTKIMTAIVAIENGDPDDIVTVAKDACGIEGSSLYLTEGETLSLRGLLYGLLLRSANDAACAIACHLFGNVDAFVCAMNEKVDKLGLKNTHFDNPHGLDSEEHYTTAEDLSKIAAYGLSLPLFREIAATEHIRIKNGDGLVRLVYNHNKLLRFYDGAIGVKTGFTKKSGRCLVSAAVRDEVTLVAVTLDDPDDWNDHIRLLDYGFSRVTKTKLCEAGEIFCDLPVFNGERQTVCIRNHEALTTVLQDPNAKITKKIECKRFAAAPIAQGDTLGYAVFYEDGREIGRVPLLADEAVAKKQSFFERIFAKS